MPNIFYSGREVWSQIGRRLHGAKRVRVAISYFGQGASKLLPLRRNDVLLVDMSIRSVSQGVTDPREVAKLIRRGVQVFSRPCLHAKYLLIDDVLLVGSANASQNSVAVLDEAALLTTDPAARRIAERCLEEWCTEPVRPRYLRQCLAAYRPPRFEAALETSRRSRSRKQRAAQPVRLWLVGGLRYFDIPEREMAQAEQAIDRAKKARRQPDRTEIDQVHYARKLHLMSQVTKGDWVVTCVRDRRGADVWPPQQLLSIESYPRGRGKRRWVMQFEALKGRESLRLRRFQRALARFVKGAKWSGRRTKPIHDSDVATAIFRLWTRAGGPSAAART